VNPEFILKAQQDENFKNILNACDLNVADGIGLKYAFVRYGMWLKERIAGVDLMHEILRLADKKCLSVYLAVNKNGLSSLEEIKASLEKSYPNVKFSGNEYDLCHPSSVTGHRDETNGDDRLLIADDCILLCNFGAPSQENFINSQKNDTMRLAMGVGGSFDFVTGRILRAPKLMRKIGLEWLWRLVQEPKYRFGRILNAVIGFPLRVLINR
jgi:N-acetylglucosaminyldiphosphoundecaprenol N-acetyl-beta-D-mannosaminyltransferase